MGYNWFCDWVLFFSALREERSEVQPFVIGQSYIPGYSPRRRYGKSLDYG